MHIKTIKQKIIFSSSPQKIYDLLMNAQEHARFTDSKVKIDSRIGGNFSMYDGYITGTTIELVPNKKIIQLWRGSDWPEGHLSLVIFEFKPRGKGCELIFTHYGVPDKFYKDISEGWKKYYWQPIKKMLESRN
jgi:activator of HSP90 ATPase